MTSCGFFCLRNEESTTLPRPPQLGVYEPLQSDAVMPLDMTPEEMEHIQHTELAYNVMRDLCQRKRLCIYQAPGASIGFFGMTCHDVL